MVVYQIKRIIVRAMRSRGCEQALFSWVSLKNGHYRCVYFMPYSEAGATRAISSISGLSSGSRISRPRSHVRRTRSLANAWLLHIHGMYHSLTAGKTLTTVLYTKQLSQYFGRKLKRWALMYNLAKLQFVQTSQTLFRTVSETL